MRRWLLLETLPLIVLSMVGCGNVGPIAKELRAFQKTSVSIPKELIVVENGQVSVQQVLTDTPLFVVYRNREQCSSCLVSQLYDDLTTLQRISEKGKCAIMVIFSPKEDECFTNAEKPRMKFAISWKSGRDGAKCLGKTAEMPHVCLGKTAESCYPGR